MQRERAGGQQRLVVPAVGGTPGRLGHVIDEITPESGILESNGDIGCAGTGDGRINGECGHGAEFSARRPRWFREVTPCLIFFSSAIGSIQMPDSGQKRLR